MRLSLAELCVPLNAELHGRDRTVRGVSIDTRTLESGDLYIAIRGERHDGHAFIAEAERKGAAAIMVSMPVDSEVPQLRVADTRLGLGALASYWAAQIAVPTIALTGSNGKTTLKEMIASVLAPLGPVLATEGNLNNDFGVPLTLLRLREEHQYAVIEMGANHIGEIAYLSGLVRPDVALVNNVGPAHLEGFGSIEAVAEAKSEIYSALDSDGWGLVNADDAFASQMREAAAHTHVRSFGFDEDADVRGVIDQGFYIETLGQRHRLKLRLPGRHNLANALAAAAAVQCLDVQPHDYIAGLESIKGVRGRLQARRGHNGARLIDDSYNANPESTRAAIDVLAAQHGKRVLILGDMAELGDDAVEWHAAIGAYAERLGVEALYTLGNLSRHASAAMSGGQHFDALDELLETVHAQLSEQVCVLVKGSRSARMERVVDGLLAARRSQTQTDAALEEQPS